MTVLINPYGFTAVGPTWDPAAATYFNAMAVAPNDTRAGLLNTLIAALKAGGSWSTYDAFYVGGSHDVQAARINAKTPAAYSLTGVNSPVFLADRWIGANAGGGYWLTGFGPTQVSEASRNMKTTEPSVTFGMWGQAAVGLTDASTFGAFDSTNGGYSLAPKTSSFNAINYRAQNLTVNTSAVVATNTGLFNIRRNGTTISARRNKSLVHELTGHPFSGVTTEQFRIGNVTGSTANPTRAAFAFVGGYKSDAVCDAEYDAMLAYLTAIGAA